MSRQSCGGASDSCMPPPFLILHQDFHETLPQAPPFPTEGCDSHLPGPPGHEDTHAGICFPAVPSRFAWQCRLPDSSSHHTVATVLFPSCTCTHCQGPQLYALFHCWTYTKSMVLGGGKTLLTTTTWPVPLRSDAYTTFSLKGLPLSHQITHQNCCLQRDWPHTPSRGASLLHSHLRVPAVTPRLRCSFLPEIINKTTKHLASGR